MLLLLLEEVLKANDGKEKVLGVFRTVTASLSLSIVDRRIEWIVVDAANGLLWLDDCSACAAKDVGGAD